MRQSFHHLCILTLTGILLAGCKKEAPSDSDASASLAILAGDSTSPGIVYHRAAMDYLLPWGSPDSLHLDLDQDSNPDLVFYGASLHSPGGLNLDYIWLRPSHSDFEIGTFIYSDSMFRCFTNYGDSVHSYIYYNLSNGNTYCRDSSSIDSFTTVYSYPGAIFHGLNDTISGTQVHSTGEIGICSHNGTTTQQFGHPVVLNSTRVYHAFVPSGVDGYLSLFWKNGNSWLPGWIGFRREGCNRILIKNWGYRTL